MNKFGKPTEEDFQTVKEVVEEMIKGSPRLVAARCKRNYPSSWCELADI